MDKDLIQVSNSPVLLKIVCTNAFQMLDVHKRGYIQFQDFENLIKEISTQMKIPMPQQTEITKAYKDIDTDNDDRINQEEFTEFVYILSQIIRIMVK